MGFWGLFLWGDVGFWVKNGAWQVNLQGLGKIGKAKTFKNVRKRLKTCVKRSKIFKNVRVLNENEQKMCTCRSYPVNRESYPVRGNSATD